MDVVSALAFFFVMASRFSLKITTNCLLMRVNCPEIATREVSLAESLFLFIISLDDFLISFFCAGASTQTLPMYIFSMIRSGTTPVVNALSTMLLLVSSLLVIIFLSLNSRKTDILP